MGLNINEASQLLVKGEVVAIPTETVYGLAADCRKDEAVTKIYTLKERPLFNPLITHVASFDMAKQFGIFGDIACKLAHYFWFVNPHPLTLIVEKKQTAQLSLLATAGLKTVAIRLPNHSKTIEIINQCGFALVAPSANKSNYISSTSANDVLKSLGDIPIVDGGPCSVGLESTIIDVSNNEPIVLRPGGLCYEKIEQYLGFKIKISHHNDNNVKAPGMLKKHYAPSIPLRMNATETKENEILLGFGPQAPSHVPNLSKKGDLNEAACNLFAMLHTLDDKKFSGIAVMPIPNNGIGFAINDRLKRASFVPQET